MKHPIQPLLEEGTGPRSIRFKRNAIVEHLLNIARKHGCDMNELAMMDFTKEDRQQFAQLIGYSLSGYGELSYVDDDSYNAAAMMAEDKTLSDRQARLVSLQAELDLLRTALREPMARLFGVHPDDLNKNL